MQTSIEATRAPTRGARGLLQRFVNSTKESRSESRARRRRGFVNLVYQRTYFLISTLLIIGYLWMIATPFPSLGRGTYMDENALQPAQVSTKWDWSDVHAADRYLESLERLRDQNATSDQRAAFIYDELLKLGVSTSTQRYKFSTTTGDSIGTNAFGIISSPRTSGNEAMVIAASWISRTGEGDGTLNLRGVSTVLALARFLKNYSMWARDIILVFGDGYLEGMQAWLTAYHGASQSNLQMDPLELSSGVIWTALCVDYPGHSFSHLGIFFEGVNGRLPNQDLINSFQRIAQYTGGVPVVIYDHANTPEAPTWIPEQLIERREANIYASQAVNIARHLGYQSRGQPSGIHGLFHQYRIDAFTMFGLPANGPHGFHAIGRIIESTLRTTNNMLERLHASFFFYLLSGPDRFIKIGNYLPSAVLVGVAMMFGGLRSWVDAAWTRAKHPEAPWTKTSRPVSASLTIMVLSHFLGALLFKSISHVSFLESPKATPLLVLVFGVIPLSMLQIASRPKADSAPQAVAQTLKAFNLCLASTVISIICVLNFSLAAILSIALGIPLLTSSSRGSLSYRAAKYVIYMVLGLGWLLCTDEVQKAVWHWEVLSVWFAPFVCIVYYPLVLQAGFVCILS